MFTLQRVLPEILMTSPKEKLKAFCPGPPYYAGHKKSSMAGSVLIRATAVKRGVCGAHTHFYTPSQPQSDGP